MPDINPQELKNHSAVSATTVHGRSSLLFGLPFAGMGIFIVLLSLGVIPCPDEKFHAPRMVVASFGGLFFLAGFFLIVNGLVDFLRESRGKSLQSQRPGERWNADYRWERPGIKDNARRQLIANFFNVSGFVVFLFPFHWLVFSVKEVPGIFRVSIFFFDFIIAGFFMYCVYLLLKLLKYGTSFFRFNQFPFYLGEKLDGVIEISRSLQELNEMTVMVRCVAERYELRGTASDRSLVVVSYQIYGDTKKISSVQQYRSNILRIPLSFELPQDKKYETSLRDRPAKYWEMEVKSQVPGIDYSAIFFVPVYAKS